MIDDVSVHENLGSCYDFTYTCTQFRDFLLKLDLVLLANNRAEGNSSHEMFSFVTKNKSLFLIDSQFVILTEFGSSTVVSRFST